MNIDIRPASSDDLPAILALDHLALQPGTGRLEFFRCAVAEKTCIEGTLA